MSRSSQASEQAAIINRAKSDMRRVILRRRKARTQQERESADSARNARLKDLVTGHAPDTVAIYLSTPPEPATRELVDWLAGRNTRVLLPVLTAPTDTDEVIGPPDWAPYAGADRLRAGRLSILEPDTEPVGAAGLRTAELIICPGVAGNGRGQRLGRGGGWYDRALTYAASTAVTVLPLNDDEVTDDIPADQWDQLVDVIVTESRTITCVSRAVDDQSPTDDQSTATPM